MRPLLLLLLAAALAAACAGAPPSPGGAADAAGLYRARCAGCHRPYDPGSRTRAAWREVLARMAPRAHLTADEAARLGAWLEAGASDAGAAGSAR